MTIDINAKTMLREILQDTQAPYEYSDFMLINALNDNRQTILYRNPYVQATGQFINRGYSAPIGVPDSETQNSILQAEPGQRIFQIAKPFRHWDSTAPVSIYVSGVVQDASTYSVDYASGRVTFNVDVGDYQPVNACFSYYKIYHAARMLLLMRFGANGSPAKIQNGPDSIKFQTTKDLIAALDALIAEMAPKNIRINRKLY